MKRALIICLFFSALVFHQVKAQCSSALLIQNQKNIPAIIPSLQHYLTARRDTSPNKAFLYIAAKEQGFYIQNISTINSPSLVSSIPCSSLSGLDVNSITQSGNLLYVALGDIFSSTAQKSGMAIIDVSNPATPVIKSVYSFTSNSGAGYVAVDGNYAYLAAMQNGIIVLNVSNPSNIQFVSRFKPSVTFPVSSPSSNDQLKINARSMVIKNNILYLCYDAGGVRIINVSDKNNLKETGRYSNPLLNARARAYNNLILNDSLIYVAADYCGMEILNVKDTAHITKIGWWNPWKCETPANTWFNSPGHTNEIDFDPVCKLVFMSAGRSDLMAVNVSNPAAPDSCSQFGLKTDSAGTWGVSRFQNQLFLGYISTWPLYIPFRSDWSGIKLLTYTSTCITNVSEYSGGEQMEVYPNPASSELRIQKRTTSRLVLQCFDTSGRMVFEKLMEGIGTFTINTTDLDRGFYFLRLNDGRYSFVKKVVLVE